MLALKEVSKLLQSARERYKRGLFIVEGKKPCLEALRIEGAVQCLFLTEGFAGSDDGIRLLSSCRKSSIEASVVAESSLKKVSELVTPEGVMASVSIKAIEGAFFGRYESALEKGFPMLFLENLQDPGNLGTIIRTAEAAGVSKIVLSRDSVDPFSPKVVRATMGSIFRVPLEVCESEEGFFESISERKREGFLFYAAALSGKQAYTDIIFEKKAAFMIGNEGSGLTERAVACADEAILIPMEGESESLNAGIAAAVILFESKRQRGKQRGNEWKRKDK